MSSTQYLNFSEIAKIVVYCITFPPFSIKMTFFFSPIERRYMEKSKINQINFHSRLHNGENVYHVHPQLNDVGGALRLKKMKSRKKNFRFLAWRSINFGFFYFLWNSNFVGDTNCLKNCDFRTFIKYLLNALNRLNYEIIQIFSTIRLSTHHFINLYSFRKKKPRHSEASDDKFIAECKHARKIIFIYVNLLKVQNQ